MKDYEQIIDARIGEEIPDFEAFFADMQERVPALKGSGAIELRPSGFKLALKAAYIAGSHDRLQQILNTDSSDS